GFRAVTARATFLCLCKETWRKESTPRLRARCCAPGPRSRRDFPSEHPVRAENAAHPCAAPLRGLVRRLRRSGGAPNVKSLKSRATATATSPQPRRAGLDPPYEATVAVSPTRREQEQLAALAPSSGASRHLLPQAGEG